MLGRDGGQQQSHELCGVPSRTLLVGILEWMSGMPRGHRVVGRRDELRFVSRGIFQPFGGRDLSSVRGGDRADIVADELQSVQRRIFQRVGGTPL